MIIAFDVDGTLIDEHDNPRYEVIDLLRAFHTLGHTIYVWSGGGQDYARRWVDRLGLWSYVDAVYAKDPTLSIDLAVDDVLDADLGRLATIYV